MRDHLRPARLFGRDYYWHAERGQPLRLLRCAPWPDPLPADKSLYDVMVGLLGGPLPWPEEGPGA